MSLKESVIVLLVLRESAYRALGTLVRTFPMVRVCMVVSSKIPGSQWIQGE